MNRSKKYEFILSKSEIKEFCRTSTIESYKQKKKIIFCSLLFFVLLYIFDLLPIPRVASWVYMAALLIVWIGIVAIGIQKNNNRLSAELTGKKITIFLEDGVIKADHEDVSGEMPCSRIELIRVTPHLLMFGYMQNTDIRQTIWYMIPLRLFESAQEQQMFLDMLHMPQSEKNIVLPNEDTVSEKTDKKTDDSTEQVYFCFDYAINEKNWVQFLKNNPDRIIRNTIKPQKRIRRFFLFFFFTFLFLIPFSYPVVWYTNLWIPAGFNFVIAVLCGLWNCFKNPVKREERSLKLQINSPFFRNTIRGRWRILLKENGVTSISPIGSAEYDPWKYMDWLVETDNAFFLYRTDKKRYVLIPKENLQDCDQISALYQLCVQKGLRAVQAKETR